jgi:hypothetical protein
MAEPLTPIEQLDLILNLLGAPELYGEKVADVYIEGKINPRRGDDYVSIVISDQDIEKVLNKLVLDGYVHQYLPPEQTGSAIIDEYLVSTGYAISWEGKYFLQQGGYAWELKERNRKAEEEDRRYKAEEVRSIQMTRLTIILAAGTAVAALYYLAKGLLWFIHEISY